MIYYSIRTYNYEKKYLMMILILKFYYNCVLFNDNVVFELLGLSKTDNSCQIKCTSNSK